MIIDCHYHLEERMLAADVLVEKMDEAGVDRVALMAAMNDPLPEPAPLLVKAGQFILAHRATRGIGRKLTANFTADGALKLPMGTYRVYDDPDNDPVFALAKKHPDRFYAWAFVNPRGSCDPLKEIDRRAISPGFVGVKAHPFWHRYLPAELAPAAERAVRHGKPLLIHAGFGEQGDFLKLVDMVPGLVLILAHAAFPAYADAWRLIRDRKNIYVDLSQTTYVGYTTTRDVVAFLGAERCLYGTDGPFGPHGADGTYDYGLIKRRIEKLFPDDKTRRLIMGENFAALAGA